MRSSSRSTCTLHLRSRRSRVTARCTSPLTPRIVWWVSSSRVTVSAGSSSHSRWRADISLSSSARVAGLTATWSAGGGQWGWRDGDRLALGGQRVAGPGPVQAGNGDEIAGDDRRGRPGGVPGEGLQGVEPLLAAGAGVDEHGVGVERA